MHHLENGGGYTGASDDEMCSLPQIAIRKQEKATNALIPLDQEEGDQS